MPTKSMIETAVDIVGEKGKLSFQELCEQICKRLGLTEEELANKAGSFYTSLTLDGRLVTLGNNVWDLRSRYKFEQTHIDMNDVYTEEPEENEESDDKVSELGQEKEEDQVRPSSEEDDEDQDAASAPPDPTAVKNPDIDREDQDS